MSRRLSAYSKPLGIGLIIFLIYYLTSEQNTTVSTNSCIKLYSFRIQKKARKIKHDENYVYEIGEKSDGFDGFSGTIVGRGVDFDVKLPVYRDGGALGNYEHTLDEIMEGKTGLGDFGKSAVTWTDDEDAAVKKSIKDMV